MALAYYGVTLPDKTNWVETPEEYLIFKNAVIGRTGYQTYKGYELDRDELKEQGVTIKDEDDIHLFRDADEVFSPKTIASFVGKSVTDGHPSELLSLENVKDHEEGQIINVRRGNDPLESGDFPLLADLIVKSKSLIDKIKAGLRELSCGYNYHVLKDGNLIKQVDILGNHVAVVEQARAGREAVIVDAAITSIDGSYGMSFLDRVLNSNSKAKLTAWAKDAKPEEIADIITQLGTEIDSRPVTVATTPAVTTTVKVVEKPALTAKDETEEKAEDIAQTLADALTGKDAAVDAGEDEEKEEEEKEKKKGEDEEEKEEEANDEGGALTIEPSDRTKALGPGADSEALQMARVEGARAVLKVLKPVIAQSGNKKLIKAYDTAARTVQAKSKGNTSGGYGKVVEAASSRGKDAQDSIDKSKTKVDDFAAVSKLYADRFNVVKR